MCDQLVLVRALERGEREQSGVIAEIARDLSLLHRLAERLERPGVNEGVEGGVGGGEVVPAAEVTTDVKSDKLPPAPSASVPPPIVVTPVYVFAPVRVIVPVPTFVRLPPLP